MVVHDNVVMYVVCGLKLLYIYGYIFVWLAVDGVWMEYHAMYVHTTHYCMLWYVNWCP